MHESQPETLSGSYAAAFADYVLDRPEIALQAAYELGREAVRRELSLLDLARIHHHAVFRALARGSADTELEATVQAAEEFFVETLSAFEVTQRESAKP